jgi:hypothetical protein
MSGGPEEGPLPTELGELSSFMEGLAGYSYENEIFCLLTVRRAPLYITLLLFLGGEKLLNPGSGISLGSY